MARCAKCGQAKRMTNQRWCHACHAAYMKAWRKRQSDDKLPNGATVADPSTEPQGSIECPT